MPVSTPSLVILWWTTFAFAAGLHLSTCALRAANMYHTPGGQAASTAEFKHQAQAVCLSTRLSVCLSMLGVVAVAVVAVIAVSS